MSVELKGVPEGWRVVRWGRPSVGETILLHHTNVPYKIPLFSAFCGSHSLIVEAFSANDQDAIRPFANSGEFLDACNGHFWLLNIETGASEFVAYVDDNGIETIRGATSYEDLVECYEFPDGRVCGHENS